MTDPIYNPPSIDPAQRNSIMGTIQFIIDKMVMQEIDDMLPAQVIAYDRTENRATVQILVTMVTTSNQQIKRAQIASVPVLQLGGGGYVLSFPINPGDLGWIKTTDVDMSLFLQQLNLSPPNTNIMHKFDSSMFIPDTMMKSVVINSEDNANVVLQTLDGTVRVAIWPDKVKVTAPEVQVISPLVEITASTSVLLDTPQTTITGALSVGTHSGATAHFNGPITGDSTMVLTGNITGQGTSLHTHVHSGVQPGGGNTGQPV